MDIKKLITDLQVCADDDIICPACERYDKMSIMGGTTECVNKLLLDAAEALKELRAHNDALECERQAWFRDQGRHRWIPVAERLPATVPCGAGTAYSEAVNVLTSGRKVLTAIWDGTEFIADAEFWEAEGEGITHWAPVLLPLPEPPKEV